MIQFPQATRVHKSIPKKAFYSHLSLTKPVQNAFVTDIDRIYVEQSLTQKNLNLNTDSKTREILVMGITVKKKTTTTAYWKPLHATITTSSSLSWTMKDCAK